MSGNAAQLAFHYQNLFCVLLFLNRIKDPTLKKFIVERKITQSSQSKEIDLVVECEEQSKSYYEYYEVKSGKFSDDEQEILNTFLKIAQIYKDDTESKYFLVLSPDFKLKVTKIYEDIEAIKSYQKLIRTKKFNFFKDRKDNDDQIKTMTDEQLFNFIKTLDLQTEDSLPGIESKILNQISKLREKIQYSDHGLKNEDLLNRLISLIISSLKADGEEAGCVSPADIYEEITDWFARNITAKRITNRGSIDNVISEDRTQAETIMRAIFPKKEFDLNTKMDFQQT